MTKKLEWMNFADEVERTPDLVDGYGFCVTRTLSHAIEVEVYDLNFIDPEDPQRVCSVFVKWDGCSHLSMNEGDCFHLCGAESWAADMDLIRRGAFTLASELLSTFNAELANWTNDRPLVRIHNEYMPKELP